ncbi:unnamed protein product [Brassica oleracea var. botrytis]
MLLPTNPSLQQEEVSPCSTATKFVSLSKSGGGGLLKKLEHEDDSSSSRQGRGKKRAGLTSDEEVSGLCIGLVLLPSSGHWNLEDGINSVAMAKEVKNLELIGGVSTRELFALNILFSNLNLVFLSLDCIRSRRTSICILQLVDTREMQLSSKLTEALEDLCRSHLKAKVVAVTKRRHLELTPVSTRRHRS